MSHILSFEKSITALRLIPACRQAGAAQLARRSFFAKAGNNKAE